jgi:hypothetical protein
MGYKDRILPNGREGYIVYLSWWSSFKDKGGKKSSAVLYEQLGRRTFSSWNLCVITHKCDSKSDEKYCYWLFFQFYVSCNDDRVFETFSF